VHGVLAKLGIPVTHTDIFGVHGQAWLDELPMPQPYAGKVASLRQLAGELSAEITLLDTVLGDLLAGHEGYAAIQALPGIGPVLAAVVVAEIGDIRRFPGPGQLACWAGLTPRHYESDTKVIRGHVTKQGSRMLRWAVVEAIQRQPASSRPRQVKDAIIARRGKQARNIAKIAAGRELLTLVYYGMRDGRIRRAAFCPPPQAGSCWPGGAGAGLIGPARPAANPPHAPGRQARRGQTKG
jgi:transposase